MAPASATSYECEKETRRSEDLTGRSLQCDFPDDVPRHRGALVNATLLFHQKCANLRAMLLSISRDDLRIRSGVVGFRRGSGAEGRERREDGADDHSLGNRKLGVCAGGVYGGSTVSRGAAASGLI